MLVYLVLFVSVTTSEVPVEGIVDVPPMVLSSDCIQIPAPDDSSLVELEAEMVNLVNAIHVTPIDEEMGDMHLVIYKIGLLVCLSLWLAFMAICIMLVVTRAAG